MRIPWPEPRLRANSGVSSPSTDRARMHHYQLSGALRRTFEPAAKEEPLSAQHKSVCGGGGGLPYHTASIAWAPRHSPTPCHAPGRHRLGAEPGSGRLLRVRPGGVVLLPPTRLRLKGFAAHSRGPHGAVEAGSPPSPATRIRRGPPIFRALSPSGLPPGAANRLARRCLATGRELGHHPWCGPAGAWAWREAPPGKSFRVRRRLSGTLLGSSASARPAWSSGCQLSS